jgi:glutamyl-tRNA reductase
MTGQMIEFLLEFKDIDYLDSFQFYRYTGADAVQHLFEVAAGLNSMVLGENQILGQLKEAYRISIENKMSDSILNRLFHKAFQSGKRVRSETDINKGASSVSYAAVELANTVYSTLQGHPVLLIGAGENGDLVLQSLKERGATNIDIINRTLSRAEVLAEKYSAKALSFDDLESALLKCDIVVTSTGSDKPVIRKEFLQKVMKKRKNKVLLLIDLSVPRNIEETVRSMKNIYLFNLDDLQKLVALNYSKRKDAIRKAKRIVREMVADFEFWLRGLKLSPTIDQLKEKMDALMVNELCNIKEELTEKEYSSLERFSGQMNKKYLGMIIKNLKTLSNNGQYVEYIDLANNLFDLNVKERIDTVEELQIGEKVE